MKTLFAKTALLQSGWAEDVVLRINDQGRITAVETGQTPPADAKTLAGPCLPGMANIHSHAFQRAMAGHTEKPTGSHDSFWTWRDIMYHFAGMITPEDLNTIASQLYIEMLKSGY
ncbi:MAG: formimidoylglutamate deiminase, partial [Pseudomonadota bacterium]